MKRIVVPVVTATVAAGLVGFFAGPAEAAGKYKPDAWVGPAGSVETHGKNVYSPPGSDEQLLTRGFSYLAVVRIQNDGKRKDRYRISAVVSAQPGASVLFRHDANGDGLHDAGDPDITAAVEAGTFKTEKIKPHKTALPILVSLNVPAPPESSLLADAFVTATSVKNPNKSDTVYAHAFNDVDP